MPDNKNAIEKTITEFIVQNSHSDTSSMQNTTLLFKEGVFDSMGFVLMVDFIEEKFSISIDNDDFTEENFESISAITEYVYKKSNVKAVI